MSRQYKKFCKTLNYIEHIHILAYTITRCISISAFAFSTWYSYRNYELNSIGLKICAVAGEIKSYKSIIKKKKKNHDKIVLLGKSKLDSIEVLIYKALINSIISHDQFVLINNILMEYEYMK